MINIGIIGCGFVSYYYLCHHYEDINIVGVYDRNDHKSKKLSQHYSCKKYDTFEEMLSDKSVDMILNLTNPKSHYEINKKILEAKKHLFSEKPITLSLEDFDDLVSISQKNNVKIVSAPANYLTNYCRALKDYLPKIGKLKTVVGMITEKDVPYHQLKNPLNMEWNITDEFNVGCNLEHAGYLLSLLTTLLGNVKHISTQKALSKFTKEYGGKRYLCSTPDIYRSELIIGDVPVMMINAITGGHDKSVTFYGEDGTIKLDNIWDYHSKIFLNDNIIDYENDELKQEWILRMDLMRPIHYFNNDHKKDNLLSMEQLRNILEVMLQIQAS